MVYVLFSPLSWEWEPLRLRKTQRDADQGQHGGSEGTDPRPPLRAVPTLQARGDGLQRHRPWQPAIQVERGRVDSQLTHTLSSGRVKTNTVQNHRDTQVSAAGRVSIVYRQYLIYSCLPCFHSFLCSVFSPASKRRMRPKGKSSWATCSAKRKKCGKCLSTK